MRPVNDHVQSIAVGIEEQSAATQDISLYSTSTSRSIDQIIDTVRS